MEIYPNKIYQQQIQSCLDNFLDKMFPCNSEGLNIAVEKLNSIFDLSDSSRKPKKMIKNDKWFDEECKNLRKKLRNLSNQKHRPRKPEPDSLW